MQKPQEKDIYIIATDLFESISKSLNCNLEILETIPGHALNGSTYYHPIYKEKLCPLLAAAHATLKGTGLVHTAPAHGPEDFLVALKNKLPVVNHAVNFCMKPFLRKHFQICLVDEDGCYTAEAGDNLEGKFVLGDGNIKVLEMVASNVMHSEIYVHSYPYDWRTKQPVILRASRQWFVNTDAIKSRAAVINLEMCFEKSV